MGPSGARLDECLCVHAEENAIVQAACNGISIQGSTIYSTLCPCSYCAKSIINAGIRCVVYRDPFAMDAVTTRLFREAGLEWIALVEPKPARGLCESGPLARTEHASEGTPGTQRP
jgi:dCMP deaminase